MTGAATAVEIGPLDCHVDIAPGGLYRYRGLMIVGDDDGMGASVVSPHRPDDEIGWGSTMMNAMEVANEEVDGFERHRR